MTLRLLSIVIFGLVPLHLLANEPGFFRIEGDEKRAARLAELFERHYHDPILRGAATLWDQWLVATTIWREISPSDVSRSLREHWRTRLLTRPIDAEGYVGTCQHAGSAHADGWPFPIWQQAHGIGYHFTFATNGFMKQLGTPRVTTTDNWTIERAHVESLDENTGLILKLDAPSARIKTPLFDIDPFISPFVGLEWTSEGLAPTDQCTLSYFTSDDSSAPPEGQVSFAPRTTLGYTTIPLPTDALKGKRLRRFELSFGNQAPAKVTLYALHSAIDSRHTINNPSFILGALDYIDATADLNFLRDILPKLRLAVAYSLKELHVREHGCAYCTWVGHDGRTGLALDKDGKRVLLRGHGVGSNYWDLLPFGSRDMLATTYLYAALTRMISLERTIASHPEWNLPTDPRPLKLEDLERLASNIKRTAQALFWHQGNDRFVATIDEDGLAHDYGYSFVNLEAIHFGIASRAQSQKIFDWLDGRRLITGDTSTGPDIYHFRFAPRASTRRNVEWYMFAWADPASIPWGGQVQDGGAVLGFSYHDVMARLQTLGPDNAWQRLAEIADWFDDVEQAGGYRAYYKSPEQGTLQGGGTAGGLGLDFEFVESVMVPATLVQGFAGLTPTLEGLRLNPRLPAAWKSLTITGYHIHGHTCDITLTPSAITLTRVQPGPRPLTLHYLGKTHTWPLNLNEPLVIRRASTAE